MLYCLFRRNTWFTNLIIVIIDQLKDIYFENKHFIRILQCSISTLSNISLKIWDKALTYFHLRIRRNRFHKTIVPDIWSLRL